jgi:cytochrome P450
VSSDIYSIQRSAKYFRDPDDFRPERWIDPSYDDTLSAARPFLLGARACIGKHLALQIVRFTLARLIFDFNFENALGDFVWERDVSSSLVWHDFNIKARVTRHKQEQGVMSS